MTTARSDRLNFAHMSDMQLITHRESVGLKLGYAARNGYSPVTVASLYESFEKLTAEISWRAHDHEIAPEYGN